MEDKYSYKNRKYDVVPYDTEWPMLFEQYASRILSIFPNVQIEHIGSTSVPGMAGKPCIDILVTVEDLHTVETHVSDMEQAGFEYAGQFLMEGSRLFRVMKDNVLLANVHFFLQKHSHIKEILTLRDYLRSHPDEVAAYSNLKKDLVRDYKDDYASYRKNKDAYMEKLKERAAQDASSK